MDFTLFNAFNEKTKFPEFKEEQKEYLITFHSTNGDDVDITLDKKIGEKVGEEIFAALVQNYEDGFYDPWLDKVSIKPLRISHLCDASELSDEEVKEVQTWFRIVGSRFIKLTNTVEQDRFIIAPSPYSKI